MNLVICLGLLVDVEEAVAAVEVGVEAAVAVVAEVGAEASVVAALEVVAVAEVRGWNGHTNHSLAAERIVLLPTFASSLGGFGRGGGRGGRGRGRGGRY